MTDQFSPARGDRFREELIRDVARSRRRTWPRPWATGALLAGGMLIGGAVSAAAAVSFVERAPDAASDPAMSAPDPVAAPPGVTPGTPIVSLLGTARSIPVSEPLEQPLDAPSGASHVRITYTCTSAGQTFWGLDPEGSNQSSSCSASDIEAGTGATWTDFSLTGDDVLVVTPVGRAEGIVTIQFVRHLPTSWGVNGAGESFGAPSSELGEPDLIAAVGVGPDGQTVEGYVRSSDLNQMYPGQPLPTSPEEALEQQEIRERLYPDGWDVPLYESDGVTRIGTFRVG